MSGTDFMKGVTASGDRLSGATISAIVGGTASVFGGGKFSNGAMTGAFSYLFNDSLHSKGNKTIFIGQKEFDILGGTEAQNNGVDADLRSIFSTEHGSKMLTVLESRRFLWIFKTSFTIDLGIPGVAQSYAFGDEIFVDPNFKGKIDSSIGRIPITTIRILAHELGHSVYGTLDNKTNDNVIKHENVIMRELGQPERVGHKGYK